ncbi:hypothetical protein KI387_035959 [Taxus chinensis]|uniref:non-specific serine/threonine protein kinase n=1 Tax=Taxus chinensis TaxID=29808 RepID=A0AA38FR65_TAXCH|nr:hypothetical protein KI387_035959 [Taxus chinensis]
MLSGGVYRFRSSSAMKMTAIMAGLLLCLATVTAQCPINLDYVRKWPWNTSYCRSIQNADQRENCRTTLRTVFGVGLAQYLRDNSIFELPDNASAIACVAAFQQQLISLGLPSDLTQNSFYNTTDFVSSPSLCAGIQTKQDWIDKVGVTSLDTACRGDLSVDSACNACFDSGQVVQAQITGTIKNITAETSLKCYYFICLYAAGVVNEFGPKNRGAASCILRVPFLHKSGSRRRALLFGFGGAAAGFFLLSSLGVCYFMWARRKGSAHHRSFVKLNRSSLEGAVEPNTGAVWFSIQKIRDATRNFSADNVIGQGGFGTVFRGTLPSGKPVAVKRIKDGSAEGDSDFINEVEIIDRIRHRNLVVLRGFGVSSDDTEGRQRFLIYDYMANGSLDEHIFAGGRNQSSRAPLMWEQRKNIAIGTAKGLRYLHEGVQPAIYHRDIKATNILLDDDMNACVADFGLAKMTTLGESQLTTRIAGTHGYLAPEYALYGQLTDRSDVYSFGVVLLEIMSGRKALDNSVEHAADYLITDWAWKLVKADKCFQVIDSRIRENGPRDLMERFVLVGILCAHVMVAFRPSMGEVLKMLEGDLQVPKIPERPLPLANQGSLTDNYASFIDSISHPSFSSTVMLR